MSSVFDLRASVGSVRIGRSSYRKDDTFFRVPVPFSYDEKGFLGKILLETARKKDIAPHNDNQRSVCSREH